MCLPVSVPSVNPYTFEPKPVTAQLFNVTTITYNITDKPISVKFIKSKRTGFSMVELLVTLVLLGLVASFVAPGVDAWLTSREAAATRMAVSSKFALLPLQASISGKPMLIDNTQQLELDDLGLSVLFTQPVMVLANGYCQGGQFSLEQNERVFYFEVLAPYCQVKRSQKTQINQ
jgi:prepilin-type N-terminal cleavage/methylation domain-containing protein